VSCSRRMPLDFSAIPVGSRIGRALRAPLKLIPEGMVLRVLQGPLRGARWVVGWSTAGCWLGSYELSKARLFASTIRPGMTVFDIGAHAGYYTLIASRLVGGSGHVVAFEPAPRNLRYLRRHLSHHVSNVTVLEAAVSDRAGVERFDLGAGSYLGRLDPAGTIDVRTTTLDELVTGRSVPSPHVLKLDIEGAESDALVGAAGILREVRPAIFLATHGSRVHDSCLSILRRSGYSVRALEHGDPACSDELIARPSPIERG
jgi:FkbM family methyltransferase